MAVERRQVEELFESVRCQSDVAKRADYLDGVCGGNAELRAEVESLLKAHDEASGFLPTVERPKPADTGETLGSRIGPYKLLQKLGEGGMGAVYMAEQEHPVRRRVALKIIKAGMDSAKVLARFDQERQALTMMDHPNIARALDAGATDTGRPYFVMELVKGIPITQYCDQEHLTPAERLELFVPVCQAVQHAHQKGIIHRDVKPSNVLIALYDGRPVPKVIDFGVAKATSQPLTERTMFTEVGSIVGTLEYMAPEQAELNNLDIDTRADIYSLGVLLYELLAGSPPFTSQQLRSAAFAEMLRMIREVEPPRPSTRLSSSAELARIAVHRKLEPQRLTKLVQYDLDWIVMKALEKDRARRYETANALAQDVRRYLDDEPVLAGPPRAGYRLRKFLRRNKGRVMAAALVLLALVGGVLGTALGLVRAEIARDETEGALRRVTNEQNNTRIALVRATDEERKARSAEAANRRIVARQYVTRGSELLEQGNRTDALAWFVAALRADAPDPEREQAHRTRIGSTARMCPRPDWAWLDGSGSLQQVGFDPSGRAAFAVTREGAELVVRVWDRATGAERFPSIHLSDPRPAVSAAEPFHLGFSSDSRRFWTAHPTAALGPMAEVRVWNADTGMPISPALPHSCDAFQFDKQAPAFTPDGKRLLTVPGVRASASGKVTAETSADGVAVLWDIDRNGPAFPPLKTTVGVAFAFLTSDGRRIVTSSAMPQNGRLRIWDAATGKPVTDELAGSVSDRSRDGHYFLRSVPSSEDPERGDSQVWDACTERPFGPLGQIGEGTGIAIPVDTSNSRHNFGLDGRRFVVMEMFMSPHNGSPKANPPRLFDTATLRPVLTDYLGDSSWCYGFSPDGRRLVTADSDSAIVRDAETGRMIGTAIPVRDGMKDFRFSPDGKRLMVFDGQRYAQLWDAENGRPVVRDLRLGASGTPAGKFGAEGRLAVVWSANEARVWDSATGTPLTPVLVHPGTIRTAEFSPDCFHLMTACTDGSLRTWPLTTGEPPARHLVHGPGSFVRAISVLGPDAERSITRTALTLGLRGNSPVRTPSKLMLWTRDRPTILSQSWESDEANVVVSPDGSRLAIRSFPGGTPSFRIHDSTTGQPAGPPMNVSGPGLRVFFAPDGQTLVSCSEQITPEIQDTLRFWDAATGQPRTAPISLPPANSGCMVAFARGGELTVAWNQQRALVWETKSGRAVTELFPPGALPVWEPDGLKMLRTRSGEFQLFDAAAGRVSTPPLKLPGQVIRDASAGTLWTLETFSNRRVSRPRDPRTGEPQGLAVELPAGPLIWLGGQADGGFEPGEVVHLLDPATGRPTGVTIRHSSLDRIAHFSRDGRRVATVVRGKAEGDVRLWLRGDESKKVYGGELWVWDARTGEPLAPPLRHVTGESPATLIDPCLSPDGARVLNHPSPEEVRIVELTPDTRSVDVLARLAEGLAGRRLNDAGVFVALEVGEYRKAWTELDALLPVPADLEYRTMAWHRQRAEAAVWANDLSAARFYMDRLVELDPTSAPMHLDLAKIALDQNDGAMAAKSAARATELDPAEPAGWQLRGRIEIAAGRWKSAGDFYQRATEIARGEHSSEELDAWRYYLFARALAGDQPAYRAACSALLAKSDLQAEPRLVLRWCTLKSGCVEDLVPLIRRVEEAATKENSETAKFDLGILAQAQLRAGKYADAVATLNSLEKRFPADVSGWDRLVRSIALARLGVAGEATIELDRARTWAQKFVYGNALVPETGEPIPDVLKLGYTLFLPEAETIVGLMESSPEAVRAAYLKSLEISQNLVHDEPQNAQAQTDLADCLGRLGHLEMGSEDFPAAVHWLDQGVAILEKLDRDGKTVSRPSPQGLLAEQRKALESCQAAERAIDNLDFALAGTEQEIPNLLGIRSRVLARRGKHADAAATAEKLAALEPVSGANLFQAAQGYALCVAAMKPASPQAGLSIEEQALQEHYAARAVELLKQSNAAGYFASPEKRARLDRDVNLDALRSRDDFKSLLSEIPAVTPEKLPPPPFTKWAYPADEHGVPGFYHMEDTEWVESKNGKVYAHFKLTGTTADYVELYDESRQTWVRLSQTNESWSTDRKQWHSIFKGAPIQDEAPKTETRPSPPAAARPKSE